MPPAIDLNPTWRIDREPASKVFLVLADAIRLDPKLKDRVRTWIIPGQYNLLRSDLARQLTNPEFQITADHCPAISLWPEPRDGQARDEANQQATLTVSCRIFVPGIDPLDGLDYWGRVQRAVLRRNLADGRNLAVLLHAAGGDGSLVRIDQPAVTRAQDSASGVVQVAEGSFSITYRIPEGED